MTKRRARRARVWEHKERNRLREMRARHDADTHLYVLAYRPNAPRLPVRRNWLWLHERVRFTVVGTQPWQCYWHVPFALSHDDWTGAYDTTPEASHG